MLFAERWRQGKLALNRAARGSVSKVLNVVDMGGVNKGGGCLYSQAMIPVKDVGSGAISSKGKRAHVDFTKSLYPT